MIEEDSENYSENDEDFTDEEDSEDEENEALADFDLQEEYKMVSLAVHGMLSPLLGAVTGAGTRIGPRCSSFDTPGSSFSVCARSWLSEQT